MNVKKIIQEEKELIGNILNEAGTDQYDSPSQENSAYESFVALVTKAYYIANNNPDVRKRCIGYLKLTAADLEEEERAYNG